MISWPQLQPSTAISGTYKAQPSDFKVREILGYTPTSDAKGQHHWLCVRKTQLTTVQVAKLIAKLVDVPVREVGYSGLKDKVAVTEQWFSVQLPALANPDWSALFASALANHGPHFAGASVELIEALRSGKKLRRGSHKQNRFEIVLRAVTDMDALLHRLQGRTLWVPNYYGEQRFGFGQDNIRQAEQMFAGKRIKDRNLRSILLSSARSWVFNHYLAERMALHGTDLIDGDVFLLAGSHSYFTADSIDTVIQQRYDEGDIQVSGPLVGDGESPATSAAMALEQQVIERFVALAKGLKSSRVKPERRALWLQPSDLQVTPVNLDSVCLAFTLPAGCFATSVLQELGDFQSPRREHGEDL